MLIKARMKDKKPMAGIDPALAAKFKAKKLGTTSSDTEVVSKFANVDVLNACPKPGDPDSAGPADAIPPAPKPRAPRTPAVKAEAPPAPATPAVERAAAVVAIQAELTIAQADLTESEAQFDSVRTEFYKCELTVEHQRAAVEALLARIVEACK
jgi:hypothetical protein